MKNVNRRHQSFDKKTIFCLYNGKDKKENEKCIQRRRFQKWRWDVDHGMGSQSVAFLTHDQF